MRLVDHLILGGSRPLGVSAPVGRMVALRAMSGCYHLDCASGIAGDMFLGACLDLGMPIEVLHDAVARLGLPGVGVEHRKAMRGGIAGTRFRVLWRAADRGAGSGGERPEPAVRASPLTTITPTPLTTSIITIGSRPSPHGHSRDLAAIRALIAGALWLRRCGTGRSRCSNVGRGGGEGAWGASRPGPLPRGGGGRFDRRPGGGGRGGRVSGSGAADVQRRSTSAAGGCGRRMASCRCRLRRRPSCSAASRCTGAAAASSPLRPGRCCWPSWWTSSWSCRLWCWRGSGMGSGSKTADRPNAVRLLRGGPGRRGARPEVMVIECEVDDLPGRGLRLSSGASARGGALDVYFTPVQMKKNRPGTLVTVLCRRPQLEALAGMLLVESGLARLPVSGGGADRGGARGRRRSRPPSGWCG